MCYLRPKAECSLDEPTTNYQAQWGGGWGGAALSRRLTSTQKGCLAKALRGQDKFAMSVCNFLGRPANTQTPMPDEMLQSYCYKAFPAWKAFFLDKMVAAYFVCLRRFLLALCHEQQNGDINVVGDVVHFDASRAASKEVLLISMYVAGYLVSLPLQVLPDQAALVDASGAVQAVTDTMLGNRTDRRAATYDATRILFVAVAHATLHVWPYVTLAVRMATHVDKAVAGSTIHKDAKTGHLFRQSPAHGSSWCLPSEIRSPGPR